MRDVVVVEGTPIYVYSEAEKRALTELAIFLSRSVVASCGRLLAALEILRSRGQVALARRVDELLARVIRDGRCPDL